jgi:hypothetical protein
VPLKTGAGKDLRSSRPEIDREGPELRFVLVTVRPSTQLRRGCNGDEWA